MAKHRKLVLEMIINESGQANIATCRMQDRDSVGVVSRSIRSTEKRIIISALVDFMAILLQ